MGRARLTSPCPCNDIGAVKSTSLVVLALALVACSGSSTESDPNLDLSASASSATSSASSSSGAGGAIPNGCNGLMNAAADVQPSNVVDDPPTPMGGSITDGTYFETAETHYAQATTGPSGAKHATTLIVTGTAWKLVTTKSGMPDYQSNELIAPAMAELNNQLTCPGSGIVLGDQFTATATELRIYQIFGGKPLVEHVYTLQP